MSRIVGEFFTPDSQFLRVIFYRCPAQSGLFLLEFAFGKKPKLKKGCVWKKKKIGVRVGCRIVAHVFPNQLSPYCLYFACAAYADKID